MAKILLYSGNALILWFEYSKCSFSSFLKVHQKLKLWLKILNTKGHFWVSNKVALIIKNSKDHKNGVKSCCRPLHHILLQTLHKRSGLPYLTRGQQNFFKNKFLSTFAIFGVCWWRNLTWEFNVRCYENCDSLRVPLHWYHQNKQVTTKWKISSPLHLNM